MSPITPQQDVYAVMLHGGAHPDAALHCATAVHELHQGTVAHFIVSLVPQADGSLPKVFIGAGIDGRLNAAWRAAVAEFLNEFLYAAAGELGADGHISAQGCAVGTSLHQLLLKHTAGKPTE